MASTAIALLLSLTSTPEEGRIRPLYPQETPRMVDGNLMQFRNLHSRT